MWNLIITEYEITQNVISLQLKLMDSLQSPLSDLYGKMFCKKKEEQLWQ